MVLVCRFNGSGALQGFNQADCSKFLQFITGTSKVPLQSFAALEGMNGIQKFQIHREDKLTDRLSFAHICFNQLDCQCTRRMINSKQIYSRRITNAPKNLDLHKLTRICSSTISISIDTISRSIDDILETKLMVGSLQPVITFRTCNSLLLAKFLTYLQTLLYAMLYIKLSCERSESQCSNCYNMYYYTYTTL
ncbi:uncharacterized protein LOC120359424 isoform X3 [Solenopsis invicta]|uniref:uncharacterized protein LOC120359424 isoform X3 n=1 Tax=Solenopsis invicta TaxID=13686 RepID=UPI00193DC35C|nr:uncharacterized protein LOC120359424 isoform X3 [Solenopsis invicta]XP_039312764.1 uncharacterized protein LOC120359424 isoform X3 [Solenopsis invicta]